MKKLTFPLAMGPLMLAQICVGTGNFTPRLVGIVNLPGQKEAWLDCRPQPSSPSTLILREGQREGAVVEVFHIDPATATVVLRPGWTNTFLTVSLPRDGEPPDTLAGSLELRDVVIEPVLSLYAACKGCSVLRWPRLPSPAFTLAAAVTNQAQAALVLEKALAEKGVVLLPDGEKFILALPEAEAGRIKPHTWTSNNPDLGSAGSEVVPPGTLCLIDADVYQAAQLYAGLLGRKLDGTQRLPGPARTISFKNQTPLTRKECARALDILLRWQGVLLVSEGNGAAKLVAEPEAGR